MSNKVGEVYLDIVARDKDFNASMNAAKAGALSLDKHFTNIGNTIARRLTLAALVTGITAASVAAIKSAAAFEKAETSMATMLGSADRARQMMKDLAALGAETPLTLPGLQNNARLLLNFGIAAEEIIPTLRMLGDVAGGDEERMSRLALSFGQMTSTGRLMGQDLLQMINAGFNPLQAISEKTGESVASLKKKMEEGSISAKMVTDAFKIVTSEGGKFYNMMKAQSVTLSGQFSTLRDNIDMAGRGVMQELTPGLTGFTNAVNDSLMSGGFFMEALNGIARAANTAFKYLAQFTRYLDTHSLSGQITENLNKQREVFEVMKSTSERGAHANSLLYAQKKKELDLLQNEEEALKNNLSIRLSDIGKFQKGELTSFEQLQAKFKNYKNDQVLTHKKANDEMLEDTKKKKEKEISEYEKAVKKVESVVSGITAHASAISGTLGQIFSQYAQNKTQEVENDQTRITTALETIYSIEKEKIEKTITDKKERDAALKALDEKKAREEKLIAERADKEKRRINREAAKREKSIALVDIAIRTGQAIMGAYASTSAISYPLNIILGSILAATYNALGAIQYGLVASQPLPAAAQGGLVVARPGGLDVKVAEAGKDEALIPLDRSVYRRMGAGLLAALDELYNTGDKKPVQNEGQIVSSSGQAEQVTLYRVAPMSREAFFADLFEASKNGELFIAKRGVQ